MNDAYILQVLKQNIPYDIVSYVIDVFCCHRNYKLNEIYKLVNMHHVPYSHQDNIPHYKLWNNGKITIIENHTVRFICKSLPFNFDCKFFSEQGSHVYILTTYENAIMIRSKMVQYIELL